MEVAWSWTARSLNLVLDMLELLSLTAVLGDGGFGKSGRGSGCGGGECLRLELWWSENAEVVAVRLMVRMSGLMIAGLDVEGMELDVWSSLVWGLG